MKDRNRKCGVCGNDFLARRASSLTKYCSRECSHEARSKNISKALIGKVVSQETCDKMSQSKSGKPWTDNMRKNIIPNLRRGEKHPMWKGGRPKCNVCGKELAVRGCSLCKSHRIVSLETRRKISENARRKREERQKLGLVNPRKTPEYIKFVRSVMERDNFTCRWCGKRGVKLNVDHIFPVCDFPEYILDMDNGRTLCLECHKKTGTYLKSPKMEGYKYSAHLADTVLITRMLSKYVESNFPVLTL